MRNRREVIRFIISRKLVSSDSRAVFFWFRRKPAASNFFLEGERASMHGQIIDGQMRIRGCAMRCLCATSELNQRPFGSNSIAM